MTNAVTSPAAKHLLEISDNAMQLDKHRSEVFHSVTENLLDVPKIAQPDINPKGAF